MPLQFQPLGDAAILIRVGHGIDDETQATVQRVLAALDQAPPPGVLDVVPAYDSIAVFHECGHAYDDSCIDALRAALERRIAAAPADAPRHEARLVEIPVHYGGADGPDLEHVAQHTGLTARRVVELHSSTEYRVAMIGFAPGFPFLAGLPRELETPRRDTPRTVVPAGSVGIAGLQTGVYPVATPGGWQLIGRTELKLFDATSEPPALLRVGDRVRFTDAA